MTFQEIKVGTYSQMVTDYLRDEIVFGKLKSGTRIKERDLTKHFGVSSIPVREALKSLESEGYIDIVPYAGAVVKHFDPQIIDELCLISLALMDVILIPAMKNMTKTDFKEAELLLDKLDSNKDFKELAKLLIQLNEVLYMPAKMQYATELALDVLRKNLRLLGILMRDIHHSNYSSQPFRKYLNLVRQHKFDEALTFRKDILKKQCNALKQFIEETPL